jgi:hypothetical protein
MKVAVVEMAVNHMRWTGKQLAGCNPSITSSELAPRESNPGE